MTDHLTENARLRAALEKALNYIENTESELGITLDCGDTARAALATPAPDAVQEAARVPQNMFHWCSSCRSVGMVHCAHPDECGSMRSFTRDELDAALRAIAGDRT